MASSYQIKPPPLKWTRAVKQRFIDAFIEHGTVKGALDSMGLTHSSAYSHRRNDPWFAEQWAAARRASSERLWDGEMHVQHHGREVTVTGKDGEPEVRVDPPSERLRAIMLNYAAKQLDADDARARARPGGQCRRPGDPARADRGDRVRPAAGVPDVTAIEAALAALPVAEAMRARAAMRGTDRRWIGTSWLRTARTGQLPPGSEWRTWLILAGRGFGKTRAGAEWVHWRAMLATDAAECRIALVGATIDDARAVMVEGVSGLLAIAPPDERPGWQPAMQRLVWPSGAEARLYSGAKPDGLRGGEFDFAWCDEIAKWAYPADAWSNLKLALRRGEAPRAVVTTTPRGGPFLERLRAEPGTVETRGSTCDNPVLSPEFVADVAALYAGTRLGRQELEGEVLTEAEDALWTRATIEACRLHLVASQRYLPVRKEPDPARFRRVVLGVDPPAGGSSGGGDECGIIVAGLRGDGSVVVLEDASTAGGEPHVWAAAVAARARYWTADCVVAEANNGGAMVGSVLHAADAGLPVKLVHASRGKAARAEPVALLYQQGRVKHAHAFPALEDQLCGMTIHGYDGPGRSPDRADALVWALTELKLGKAPPEPRVRVV